MKTGSFFTMTSTGQRVVVHGYYTTRWGIDHRSEITHLATGASVGAEYSLPLPARWGIDHWADRWMITHLATGASVGAEYSFNKAKATISKLNQAFDGWERLGAFGAPKGTSADIHDANSVIERIVGVYVDGFPFFCHDSTVSNGVPCPHCHGHDLQCPFCGDTLVIHGVEHQPPENPAASFLSIPNGLPLCAANAGNVMSLPDNICGADIWISRPSGVCWQPKPCPIHASNHAPSVPEACTLTEAQIVKVVERVVEVVEDHGRIYVTRGLRALISAAIRDALKGGV